MLMRPTHHCRSLGLPVQTGPGTRSVHHTSVSDALWPTQCVVSCAPIATLRYRHGHDMVLRE